MMNKLINRVTKFRVKVELNCYWSFIVYESYTKLSLGE